MKSLRSRKPLAVLAGFFLGLLLMPAVNHAALEAMGDEAMADVNGQALFMASRETRLSSPALGGNNLTYGFYKMGLDVQLDINTNIQELKLGEDPAGTDLWIKNFAMGCTANAAGTCVGSESGTATQLVPFTLLRPFIQIAIKDETNPATREVVGVRLGAQQARGPFSAGNFLSFSGYLNGTASIEMQEMGGGTGPGGTTRNNPAVDTLNNPSSPAGCAGNVCRGVALTTSSDFNRGARWNVPGNNTNGWNFGFASQSLVLGLANTDEFLVKFNAITRNGLGVVASGRRQSQALIQGLDLGTIVDEMLGTVDLTASTNALGLALPGSLLPALKGTIGDNLKNQLAVDLGVNGTNGGTGVGSDHYNLNNYKMPFNLENFHSTYVNSNLFGLSFQKEDGVLYPGYNAAMKKGWSMYLPNAFSLNISNPTVQFVANIGTGAARAGNIIGLPNTVGGGGLVYDNCWGARVFC